MNRTVAVFAVVLVLVAPVGLGVVAATQDDGTGTTSASDSSNSSSPRAWTPPGPYTYENLRQSGSHDPDAADSIRLIGDPVRGGLGIRYKPAKPFENEWTWLEQGSTVRTDRIQVKGTAFGDATGEYTLVIVYWEQASKRVQTGDGIVSRTYAANQTVQKVTLDLENGYSKQWVELRSVFGGEKRVSMWLERDGEVVSGARWQYYHETNPLAKAPASPMTSRMDLYEFVFIYILCISVPGILLARRTAKHVLERTVISTQWGLGAWFGIMLVFLMLGMTAAWWQLSVIAAQLPAVFGFLITGVAFIGYMGMFDNQVERAEFNRKNLEDTTSVTGDESKRARTEDIKLRNIVRRNGKIYMPAPGIRPLIARYWAKPAQVDESDLKTVNDTTGDVSKKYEIDPDEDKTLSHTPAHLSFEPQWTRELTVEERESIDEQVAKYAEMDGLAASLMTFPLAVKKSLLGINWQYVLVAVGGFLAIYSAVNATLGLPAVGGLLGLFPGLIAGTKAKDGSLDFEPAAYHFSEARAILATERATQKTAKTFEQLQQLVVDQDMEETERLLDMVDTVREAYSEKMDDYLGTGTSDGEPGPASTRKAEAADD